MSDDNTKYRDPKRFHTSFFGTITVDLATIFLDGDKLRASVVEDGKKLSQIVIRDREARIAGDKTTEA